MTPETARPSWLELRRARLERAAFGLNAAIFLIGAWDGLDTRAPLWTVVVGVVLGLVQFAALVRSRRGPLPERFPYVLAAIGMAASALAVVHHRSGLPFAYLLVALLNIALAVLGPKGLRRLLGRDRSIEISS